MMWHQVTATARPWLRLRLRDPATASGSGSASSSQQTTTARPWLRLRLDGSGGPLQIRRRLPASAGLLQIRPGFRFILRETVSFTISADDGGTAPATAPGSLPATWAGSSFPGRELPGRLPAPGASWPPSGIHPARRLRLRFRLLLSLKKKPFSKPYQTATAGRLRDPFRRPGPGASSRQPGSGPASRSESGGFFRKGFYIISITTRYQTYIGPVLARFRRPGRELPGPGFGSGIRPRPSGPSKKIFCPESIDFSGLPAFPPSFSEKFLKICA